MNIAVLSLSTPGAQVAEDILKAIPDTELHLHVDVPGYEGIPRFERVIDKTAELFPAYDGLVFIMPTGVAVRAIAPLIQHKKKDPAVVAVDIGGRWAVSLLSGHEGGANNLANAVANALDGEPIISTSTEARRSLIAGVGCRRGTAAATILEAIDLALANIRAERGCLRMIASVNAKAQEPGLISAAATLDVPLRIIGDERIRQCPRDFSPTAAARHIDVPAVAEPAALLGGWRTSLCLRKLIHNGVTVALAREACPWSASDPAEPPTVPPLL